MRKVSQMLHRLDPAVTPCSSRLPATPPTAAHNTTQRLQYVHCCLCTAVSALLSLHCCLCTAVSALLSLHCWRLVGLTSTTTNMRRPFSQHHRENPKDSTSCEDSSCRTPLSLTHTLTHTPRYYSHTGQTLILCMRQPHSSTSHYPASYTAASPQATHTTDSRLGRALLQPTTDSRLGRALLTLPLHA
jgi:hypothetical protein